jgi:hypothetical protein
MTRRWVLTALSLVVAGALFRAIPASAASLPPEEVPATCPVSVRHSPPFVPPHPYPANAPYGAAWIGTDRLWVVTDASGVWQGIGRETSNGPVYRNKQFWWRPGYHGPSEPVPALLVTGRRLDADAAPLVVGPATNAHVPDFGGWTMLVMPEIPGGCWELTGQYGREQVRLVVWVPSNRESTRGSALRP